VSLLSLKETVRRFIEEVFNQNPSQGVQEFAAQDYINHDPTGKATQGAAQNVAGFRWAFPDVQMTITQLLGEGDLVAVQWTASGTHRQPIAHLAPEFARPPTGKTATVTGLSLLRFSGDKIEEVWNYWDTHHLLGQLSAP
jgi:predicted ester cyclase